MKMFLDKPPAKAEEWLKACTWARYNGDEHWTKLLVFGELSQSSVPSKASLAELVVGTGVAGIGDYALANCSSLSSVSVPSSVLSVGQFIFQNSGLKEAWISDSLTTPSRNGKGMFYGCHSLESVHLGASMNALKDNMLYDCWSLKELQVPDAVAGIGAWALYSCTSLEKIVFGKSFKSIWNSSFVRCRACELYDFSACEQKVQLMSGIDTFKETSSTKKIVVADEQYDEYMADQAWQSMLASYGGTVVKSSELES